MQNQAHKLPKDMFKFDFAISYAGEDRGIANDLHRLLTQKDVKVFLAGNERVYLWGKRLKEELRNTFGTDTRFAVCLISKYYVEKFYTRYEFYSAKAAELNRDYEVILPIYIDKVPLEGLEEDVYYIDLRSEGILNTVETMIKKLMEIHPRKKVSTPTIWTVTYGINFKDLFENYELPPSVPRADPYLSDWLEQDLMKHLSQSHLKSLKLLEDARSGETLSIRVGFKWNPDETPLDLGDIGWWEVLEVVPFEAIYPNQNLNKVF